MSPPRGARAAGASTGPAAAGPAPPRRPGPGQARPGPSDPVDPDDFGDADRGEAAAGPPPAETPLGRLRAHRPYWLRTMHQIGVVCALTLSVLDIGYRLDWDPARGRPSPVWLRNHPSAVSHRDFVSSKVAEGVATGTMRHCTRAELTCILPLGVAVNSAGKLRLIWDGRHVNRHLPRYKFRMETLQREGRALFERSAWGGTADLSSAYHHIEIHGDSTSYLGFEWQGEFFYFAVLPFGISTAPWLFTTVMGHCGRFLRSPGLGLDLLLYLDDLVFAAATAAGSLSAARTLLTTLRKFGWLVNEAKCTGTSEALQIFTALGTVVDLATQLYRVPSATVTRILDAAQRLATGPPAAPVRTVARLKGLITATWVAVGAATRVRTRAFDSVIELRPPANPSDKRAIRRSWAATVPVSQAARDEARWWIEFLPAHNGQPIRPRPFDSSVDGDIASDASDTGVGAFISTAPGPASGPSALLRALLDRAPAGMSATAVESAARRGIEFMAALPPALRQASSTLRELYGIAVFIMAVLPLLRGGRFRVFMDNLGCVFILGGVAPPFAVGGKQWGEYASGGSPDPSLQLLALRLFQAQLDGDFQLQPVWVPRDQNVRADFLSHASESRQHDYRLLPHIFARLDRRWGPHTIDRFACAATCQPLSAPFSGRFCCEYFHPSAVWTDAFSAPWVDDNNWLFPPVPLIGRALNYARASGARGTLIVPLSPGCPWGPLLRPRGRWIPEISEALLLGSPADCLRLPARYRSLFLRSDIYALRLGGRPPRADGPRAGLAPGALRP